MNDDNRRSLRQAAEGVEGAHSRVTELLGSAHLGLGQADPDRMTPKELAALREINIDLREACTRLWNLCEQGRA